MTLKEQIELRRRQWAEFNRWEAEQPRVDRNPAALVADVGALYSWLAVEVRSCDPDPEKLGIQQMHSTLSRLNPKDD